jgi:diguanylate cyclase (GGDEF)-like protein/PAS domain S-box-containing protein
VNNKVKRCIAVMLSLILLSVQAHAKRLTKVTIELKWFHQFQFAGIYAAIEKGFYAKKGLQVEILERNKHTNPIEDVLKGKAQFGIADSTLIKARLQGKPVIVLATIFQHSPLILITKQDDKITTPIGLKDKKIMYQADVDDAQIIGMLNEFGMTKKDIKPINHTFKDDALFTDDIDAMSAYIGNQPFYFRKKGRKINIINPANYGIDFYGDMLFTSEKFFNKNRKTALAFRQATIEGWQYALDNPKKVIEWLITKYKSKKSKQALLFEAQVINRMISPDLITLGHYNKQRIDRIASIYKKQGGISKEANLEGLYYNDDIFEISDYADIIIFTAILIILIILTLLLFNKKLKQRVAQKTNELLTATKDIKRYFDIINKYIITTRQDTKGYITEVSEAYARLSGFSKQELIGQKKTYFYHPDFPPITIQKIRVAIESAKIWHGEVIFRNKKGGKYYLDTTITPVLTKNNTIRGFTTVHIDITDKKRIEALSNTDSLTGLANRHKLNEDLEYETKRSKRYQHPMSVIILDIDHFKSINDNHGHLIGDKTLAEIAKCIKENIRESDISGRWGGEEFLILCPNTSLEQAEFVAEKIRIAIDTHSFEDVKHITSSFGIAEYVINEPVEHLIDRADKALYEAKRKGRNRVCTS